MTAAQLRAAVREILADALDRHISRPVAEGRGVERIEAITKGDAPGQGGKSVAMAILQEEERRKPRGEAATRAARRLARDRLDPAEVYAIAQKLRRWRREETRMHTCASERLPTA